MYKQLLYQSQLVDIHNQTFPVNVSNVALIPTLATYKMCRSDDKEIPGIMASTT